MSSILIGGTRPIVSLPLILRGKEFYFLGKFVSRSNTPFFSMAQSELTPMMKQFYDLKEKNPDAIMLFRCGDFYETYAKDAVTASQVLGITLTRRNK